MIERSSITGWLLCCVILIGLVIVMSGTSFARMGRGGAGMSVESAAASAHQGLDGCSSGTGKALYDCVSRVLLQFCGNISHSDVPQVDTTLRSAAAGLRAAINKVQALSAIVLAQSAIAGALRSVRTVVASNAPVTGWGAGSGLNAVASVLAHAAKLIQAKG
jgi:hypothetical protein